jgi:hypothetical protein
MCGALAVLTEGEAPAAPARGVDMTDRAADRSNPGVLTPDGLRLAVGLIAMALPFVLAIGKMLLDGGGGVLGSISDYYYTGMRNVLVGALSAFSVFLASYRGYGPKDNWSTNLAAVLSVGVAFFPTTPAQGATSSQQIVGKIHLICAAAFFITIALVSITLFTKTKPGSDQRTQRKLQRNRVYVVCGWIILACVAAVFVLGLMSATVSVKQLQPTFWLESIAVFAFGVSWFVKSETVLADRPGVDIPPEQGSHAAPVPN